MKHELHRRSVLRGLGTALALPLFEATSFSRASLGGQLFAAGADGSRVVPGLGGAPRRMAYIFVPNGVNLAHWTPTGTGRRFELPNILEPLAPFREKLNILSGLTNDKGRANGDGAGDHARSASVFLTGAQPVKTSGAGIRSGISVDQVAARMVGQATRFSSLELSCERGGNSGNCDSGYSCAYSHNISWAGSRTPMAKEVDPRRVFDRLFAGGTKREVDRSRALRDARKKSLLDFVQGEAKGLRQHLGSSDRRKLDEYLTGVRELEGRMERAAGQKARVIEEPDGLPPEPGGRLPFEEHVRLLSDLLVLAFQTDSTRISTFMFASAGSNRNYRQVGVPDGHHGISHHQRNPEKLDKIRKINRYHVEQLAYLLGRMDSIQEGEGTLLDNTMLVYGSGISDGNRHNNENLPILLAGRGGGTIETGRHLRYDVETPLCNLYLSMLDRMGASVPSFGDSTGELRRLGG